MISGGIFFDDDEAKDMRDAFQASVELYNFSATVETVARGETLTASKHVCKMASTEVRIIPRLKGTVKMRLSLKSLFRAPSTLESDNANIAVESQTKERITNIDEKLH